MRRHSCGARAFHNTLRLGVVAGGAERLPQPGILLVVAVPAASPVAVGAVGALPVGVAGQDKAPLGLAGVHPAEGGCGEGHEQPRMGGHRLGDTLTALQPSGQELVGVGPVGGRTRRAPGLPAGAAGLQQHPVRLPLRVIDLPDLAGSPVGLLDPAGQADRVMAVAGLGNQLGPAVIACSGPVHDLAENAGEQLAHVNRLRHAASPGSGVGVTTRRPGA